MNRVKSQLMLETESLGCFEVVWSELSLQEGRWRLHVGALLPSGIRHLSGRNGHQVCCEPKVRKSCCLSRRASFDGE